MNLQLLNQTRSTAARQVDVKLPLIRMRNAFSGAEYHIRADKPIEHVRISIEKAGFRIRILEPEKDYYSLVLLHDQPMQYEIYINNN
jgi:hypothetical protein